MFKNKEIVATSDGSKTIFSQELNESYHSKHGAITEAFHVFIKNGLDLVPNKQSINILEIGFGTGLNCEITMLESLKRKQSINYTSVEKFPLENDTIRELNYFDKVFSFFQEELDLEYSKKQCQLINTCSWDKTHPITDLFTLQKQQKDFFKITELDKFDLVYFDAFSPRIQPELWDKKLFTIMYNSMKQNSILTTYSAKGSVRRALIEIGFEVRKVAGPPGKREMIIAHKN